MNGVAAGGTGVTVDGTEANSNPEARSLSQYGGQNQISVMSIDSIQEVQIIKGVLARGVRRSGRRPGQHDQPLGHQHLPWLRVLQPSEREAETTRNFLSTARRRRSITSTSTAARSVVPVLKNKAFFFTTYEGYREKSAQNLIRHCALSGRPRTRCWRRCRFQKRRSCSTPCRCHRADRLGAGVVNTDVGRYRGLGAQVRTRITSWQRQTSRCSMAPIWRSPTRACGRSRWKPRSSVNKANDREFPNYQDRVAAQYVMTNGAWVSESRFGWNQTYLARLDDFLSMIGPNKPTEILHYGRRVGLLSITALFGTRSCRNLRHARHADASTRSSAAGIHRHLFKTGFRCMRENRQSRESADSEIHLPDVGRRAGEYSERRINISFGAPKHKSHLDEYSSFLQDDWRLGRSLVLNLGLRYDYYATDQGHPTTDVPVEIVNLAPVTALDKLDFGGSSIR